jgi:hypothetical protein
MSEVEDKTLCALQQEGYIDQYGGFQETDSA